MTGRLALLLGLLFLLPAGSRSQVTSCTGDCNASGAVTVDELVLGVNIALERSAVALCLALDANQDGRVTVDELVAAVSNALRECAAPVATPTPTPRGDTRTPTVLSGVIEADSFTLAAGELAIFSGDLTIRTTGAVRIDGELRSGAGSGQSVFVDAAGSVEVGGVIAAGDGPVGSSTFARAGRGSGATGTDGGSVVLASNADITLLPGARLVAGDGTDGGDGGDVVLSAPSGSISIPNGNDVIHVGNGGDTAALAEDAANPSLPDDLDNHGGASGILLMSAQSVNANGAQPVVLTRDFTPTNSTLMFTTGAAGFTTVAMPLVSGGRGGNAGSFNFEPEVPGMPAILSRGTGVAHGGLGIDPVVRRGASGGDGFLFGGAGADVTIVGLGSASVTGIGGDGGGCVRLFDPLLCTPGPGGDADVQGGDGSDATAPGGAGDDGGGATAIGGNSTNDRENPEAATAFGIGGDANAVGGNGGDGGDDCPNGGSTAAVGSGLGAADGGPGGNGGPAEALGGNPFDAAPDTTRGLTTARGGTGGNGGDGEEGGGPGGAGGSADFLREEDVLKMGSSRIPGAPGLMGGLCDPTPTPTPSNTVSTPPGGATSTPTATRTATGTPTRTRTGTSTRTQTATRTPTPSTTQTGTPTPTCAPAPLAGIEGSYVLSGTLIADSCANAPPTIANPEVSVRVTNDVVTILSTAAVAGTYDETDCAWRGEGARSIPPATLLREVYEGAWSQDEMGIVFRGTLTFIFINPITQQEICRTTYRVELRRLPS